MIAIPVVPGEGEGSEGEVVRGGVVTEQPSAKRVHSEPSTSVDDMYVKILLSD